MNLISPSLSQVKNIENLHKIQSLKFEKIHKNEVLELKKKLIKENHDEVRN